MKKEFKGTKGEWELYQKDHWCEVQIKEPLKSICAININVEEHIANAKLIANAKKLLKVIQEFVSDFEGDYVIDDGRIVDNPSNILINNYEVMKKVLEETLT